MEERSRGTNPSGAAAQVSLEDFAEAVTRGVIRALQADDVAGYAAPGLAGGDVSRIVRGPIIFGIWFPDGPFGQGQLPGSLGGQLGGQAGGLTGRA